MRGILYCSILAVVLSACGNRHIVSQKQLDFESGAWSYSDILEIPFEIKDTTMAYDLVLSISHQDSFGYENVYTKIHTQFPNQEKQTSMVSIQLADNSGSWMGKKRGTQVRIEVPLIKDVYFTEQGEHSIGIEQYSRDKNLAGINRIQFQLMKAN